MASAWRPALPAPTANTEQEDSDSERSVNAGRTSGRALRDSQRGSKEAKLEEVLTGAVQQSNAQEAAANRAES